ncbi:MAG: hypothetical protein HC856_09175 [Pseudanabaena sp. RU_4_16]|nr:hypothetical protein [Pseudanabaena sp. SU_2_4]NJM28331.1 hypothetical protein [Pseudanabaena sp. RU_4_16]NKB18625.1 hypothetical protein [Pseudanabaena sp. CRU_2_10]
MRNIIENISLKRLSWLAALPVSLAAFSASIVPAQASEHHRKDNYNYSYCSRWEHRHDYRCTGYYHPRYERHHSRYDKWDYRHHKKDHHNRDRSDWKR